MKAKISEIFESIQGEGAYLGERQLFLRFFGCNLKCSFCDTSLEQFSEYDGAALKEEVLKYKGYHSLALTGGEPLCQVDFLKCFLENIRDLNIKTYLETNGTLVHALAQVIDLIDIVSMDFKLPSASGCGFLWRAHDDFLRIASKKDVSVKMVITQETQEDDILMARNIIRMIKPDMCVVLQPAWAQAGMELLEKMTLFKRDFTLFGIHDVRILPQAHKLMGIR